MTGRKRVASREGERAAESPASVGLFNVVASEKPQETERESLRRRVARLLRLATRVRPDASSPAASLRSRAARATKADEVKLKRAVSRLKGAASLGKRLGSGPDGQATSQSLS